MAFPSPRKVTHAALIVSLLEARPTGLKSIGSTSLVFRVQTSSGQRAAYKPRASPRTEGFRAELNAYRLAVILGIREVPPAVYHRMRVENIRSLLTSTDRRFWSEFNRLLIPVSKSEAQRSATTTSKSGSPSDSPSGTMAGPSVHGALIHWIDDLTPLPLERGRHWAQWHAWLNADAAMPEGEDRALASTISTMIVFDYLIGNWDRFSGGNTSTTREGGQRHLLMRDNDAAFMTPMPTRLLDRMRGHLVSVERFSATLVHKLFTTSPEWMRAYLMQTLPEVAQLREDEWQAVLDRRLTILSHIEALMDERGKDKVLVFP